MIDIPLLAVPNQSLSIRLDNQFYTIRIVYTEGVMSVSIKRGNINVISNQRAVAGFPIIPYTYLENGNFAILTKNGDYPNYNQFGTTQTFVFATQAELEAIRAAA